MAKTSKRKKRGKPLVVAVIDDKLGPRKPPRRVDGTPGNVFVSSAANNSPFVRPTGTPVGNLRKGIRGRSPNS
jgi:hypothetical protein